MRTFKIMNEGYPGVPGEVPWEFMAPGEAQALRNHSQTLERLNERGGLGVDEALAVLANRRWERLDKIKAAQWFNHLLREFNDRDAIMPGAWYCPQCDFRLQKSVLHASSGTITANTSPLNEICPNDGQMMKPLTWRKANEDWSKLLDRKIDESKILESQLNKEINRHKDIISELHRENDSLKKFKLAVDDALDMASPYPLPEVIITLASFVEHLMRDHDCDHQGHERAGFVLDKSKVSIEKLRHVLSIRNAGNISA